MHPQLGSVGIVDLLEADPRPTFIVDIANAIDTPEQDTLVAYYNPALASCDDLVDLLDASRAQHAALWEWIISSIKPPSLTKTRSSSASDSPITSFYYLNAQWSKCLVRQRWLVVGANEQPSSADRPRKVRLDSQKGGFGVSGSANTVASSVHDPTLPRGVGRQSLRMLGEPESVPPTQSMSIEPNWILPEITLDPKPYMDIVASYDWASTPLGLPDTWPSLLKQSYDQIMVDARPIAIFWGDQYLLIFNEAFSTLCGSLPPSLMGKPIIDAWAESAVRLRDIMVSAAQQPRAVVEDEWRFFLGNTDEALLEELYIKWSLVPITDGDKVLGFMHPVLETTAIRLWERRMKALIDLGNALVTAQEVSSYWPKVLEALGAVTPDYDIPLAALYSVRDESLSGSPQKSPRKRSGLDGTSKVCRFEGGLGVPADHPLASFNIPLRIGAVGLAHIFREAILSPASLHLETKNGSLPEYLLQGLQWRGFGDACRNVVVLPIRPNRGEHATGLLLLGLNQRRPYDNDYRQFISLLNQKLNTTLASTMLLEEEARKGRNAVQEAAHEQALLELELAHRKREATESLKKFEAVADFIPIGMAFQNAQGVLTYANDAWHRITGNPQGETGPSIALRDILSYIVEEDRPDVVRAYERLASEDSVTFECRLVRRNAFNSPPLLTRESSSFEKAGIELQGVDEQASERHILAAARAERAPDGTVLQTLTCFSDVTIHRQTVEEALRRAQQAENLKRMAELATVGMYEIDLEGNLVEANNVFFEMCGLEKDSHDMKTILKPWETCVYEEDLPVLERVMSKVINEGTPQTCEIRFKLARKIFDSHGTEIIAPRWALGTFMPVVASDGTVESFCGCVSDVSLQKWQLDQERLRKEEALESKRQQENFIDMTSHEMRNPLSAIIHCADAVIASLSKALDLPLSKKTHSSMVSTNSGGKLGGKTRPEDQLLMESSVENAETIIACAQHQKRIVDDILTMSKLDSKLLAVTPITVDPLEIAKEALRMFEVEARRVDIDLQMKVDPSYHRHHLEYLDLDPSRLKQVLINLLTNALKFTKSGPTRNVTITLSASIERPNDSTCAVEFIPPLEGDDLQPKFPTRADPIYFMVEVKDTGQGLTEEEMKSLFQRFQQASARTHVKYGGSGLGLFISRRLCEMHNGAIGVASLPGVGSTFAFYVEAYRPDEAALKEARVSKRTALQAVALPITKRAESLQIGSVEVPLSSTPSRDMNSTVASPDSVDSEFLPEPPKIEGVLVVEDNMINQQLTRRGLADRGFTVDVANHGLEALDKLRASNRWAEDDGLTDDHVPKTSLTTPDMTAPSGRYSHATTDIANTAAGIKFPLSLILMDVEMPIQDGLSCTRQIRELEQQGKILGGHLPIIAVSANARLEQILEAKAAGCDDVMIKPYRMPELVEKMKVVALQAAQKNSAAAAVAANVLATPRTPVVVESVEREMEGVEAPEDRPGPSSGGGQA